MLLQLYTAEGALPCCPPCALTSTGLICPRLSLADATPTPKPAACRQQGQQSQTNSKRVHLTPSQQAGRCMTCGWQQPAPQPLASCYPEADTPTWQAAMAALPSGAGRSCLKDPFMSPSTRSVWSKSKAHTHRAPCGVQWQPRAQVVGVRGQAMQATVQCLLGVEAGGIASSSPCAPH